jgi:hypothetical protein
MVRARLSENRSTAATFREGDLLVATLLPISTAVHQVSFVVRVDGRFESSERLTGSPGRNSIYHKETGEIELPVLEFVRSKVDALATAAEPICLASMEGQIDPFEHEGRDRRSLGYEFRTEQRTLSTWMLNYCGGREPESDCLALFNEIWQRLLGHLVMRHFTFDADFTTPAQSLE